MEIVFAEKSFVGMKAANAFHCLFAFITFGKLENTNIPNFLRSCFGVSAKTLSCLSSERTGC